MRYYAATDKLTTFFFTGSVEVTEEVYKLLLDGITKQKKQVVVNGSEVYLRTAPPNGTGEGYTYKPLLDKWEKSSPPDYDGENYTYNPVNDTWFPVGEREETGV